MARGMFAFGTHVTNEASAARYLAAGLTTAAEPDAIVYEAANEPAAGIAWAEILAAAACEPSLEGLVLVRCDAEIRDPQLVTQLRAAFADDPGCGIVGAAGARAITSLRWWEGVTAGALSTPAGTVELGPAGEVHAVDGALLALSATAVRALCSEPLPTGAFGHDIELCWRARLRGLRVKVVATTVHVHGPALRDDLPGFAESDHAFRARWSAA